MRLEGWHIVIVVVLAIVLFGAPKLPGLARSVGQSLRIFKSEVRQLKDENNTPDPVTGTVQPNTAADGIVPGPAVYVQGEVPARPVPLKKDGIS